MISGVIGKVFEKPFGNKVFYSFALNGQDGFFGNRDKRPPAIGTSVRFEEKTNAKGYKEVNGAIEILQDGSVGPAPETKRFGSNGGGSSGKSGGASNDYWDKRNERDVLNDKLRELGASRNTALTIIDMMLKYEAVRLPATAKREEFLFNLLEKYTKTLMGKANETEASNDEAASGSDSKTSQGDSGGAGTDDWN